MFYVAKCKRLPGRVSLLTVAMGWYVTLRLQMVALLWDGWWLVNHINFRWASYLKMAELFRNNIFKRWAIRKSWSVPGATSVATRCMWAFFFWEVWGIIAMFWSQFLLSDFHEYRHIGSWSRHVVTHPLAGVDRWELVKAIPTRNYPLVN